MRDSPVRTLVPVLTGPKAVPTGWPAKQAAPVWSWLSCQRPPLSVVVAGAEGGVGATTIAALVAETVAAGSPGPVMVLDQCGSSWGSLSRRLLGQRDGLPAERAHSMLHHGIPALRVLRSAPTTSAGATVLSDAASYVPTRELFCMVQTPCGAMVTDAGPVNLLLVARLDPQPVLVLVGRADVIGAEATCAALGFLARRATVRPVVVLCSPTPQDRRRARAARSLVAATGVQHLVQMPFDARLAATNLPRLDQMSKPIAAACLEITAAIATTQEAFGHGC